ncbi:hypothetical protein [Kitasatospora sp. LaBMicrA B282]|uniref:hypothetical protein n=1 Tax=Kitasatospora sp. LaBMicrA B282 TaxID=3420949 RepID=UPI003D124113
MTEHEDDTPSTSRVTRRRRWAGAIAAVLVAAGVTAFWWKPWQSVVLPQSACWSVLGPDDLRPLVGTNGTAVDHSGAEIVTPMTAGLGSGQSYCAVRWAGDSVLEATVQPSRNGLAMSGVQSRGGHALDFGPDAQGWIDDQHDILEFYLRCDFQVPAEWADGPATPYVWITIDGAPEDSQYSLTRVRQAYADIALKIARTVVTQYQCTNPVHLADKAPTVPAAAKETTP